METMSMIDNDWLPAIQDEFKKDYYRDLYRFVKEEYSNTVIYPPAEDIFNAFHFTPLSKVKVLLLGHAQEEHLLPNQYAIPFQHNVSYIDQVQLLHLHISWI